MNDLGVRMRIDRAYEVGGLLYVDGKGMAGQRFKKVLVNEQHGMASTPPLGATGWVTMPGGRPDLAYISHIQHDGFRPGVPAGAAVLYNQFGQLIKMYSDEITIEAGAKFQVNASEIVLNGVCKLGGEGASTPASRQGTVDTGGFADTTNLATKVFVL
jgi:phage gp45-like